MVAPRLEFFYDRALKRLREVGRKNIAIIALANTDVWEMIPRIKRCFSKHKLKWHDEWMQGAPLPGTEWARKNVQLLFSANARIRPDALIVADDNLAPAVAAALRKLSVRVPDDLHVVSLCNYPTIPKVDLDFEWVGYDLFQVLQNATELFRRLREGLSIPLSTRIPARHYAEK